MEYEDCNVVFIDNNKNFYGILKVHSRFNEQYIHFRLKNIIISEFGDEERFFEDFSSHLSIVLEIFDNEVVAQRNWCIYKF